MNHVKNVIVLSILTSGLFFLNSCKKEEPIKLTETKKDLTAISQQLTKVTSKNMETYSAVQGMMIGIIQYGGQHFKTDGNGFLSGFPCASVTKDTVSVPHTATVDFGAGCQNAAGKFMSGSITVEYLDKEFTAPGNYYRAIFNNFVNDSRTVSGTMLMTYRGYQLSGYEGASIEANLETNFAKDELKFTGRNHFNLEVITDSVTEEMSMLTFSGSGDGITSDGTAFTQTITSPLQMQTVCSEHFSAGTVLIQSPGLPDKEIDYGNGTCDDKATVHENGSTYDISLQ